MTEFWDIYEQCEILCSVREKEKNNESASEDMYNPWMNF